MGRLTESMGRLTESMRYLICTGGHLNKHNQNLMGPSANLTAMRVHW